MLGRHVRRRSSLVVKRVRGNGRLDKKKIKGEGGRRNSVRKKKQKKTRLVYYDAADVLCVNKCD